MLARDQVEAQLAKALSRHIGYTSGAFYLGRFADIAFLVAKPSLYAFELVKAVQSWKAQEANEEVSPDYATDIVNFCSAIGLIERAPGQAQANLIRYVLSAEALTLRAANRLDLRDLHDLVLLSLLIENDSDGYGTVLELMDLGKEEAERRGSILAERYLESVKKMRHSRFAWLGSVFPQPRLLESIVARIPWLRAVRGKGPQVVEPQTDFGRHHSSPRKGWAEYLGHADATTGELTTAGAHLLNRLRGGTGRYTWLAPPDTVLEALRIPPEKRLPGPSGPAWEVLRPPDPAERTEVSDDVIQRVAKFMENAYPCLRFEHANQASMQPVALYLYSIERALGYRLSRTAAFEAVFREFSSIFAPMSSRTAKMAYYLVRAKK